MPPQRPQRVRIGEHLDVPFFDVQPVGDRAGKVAQPGDDGVVVHGVFVLVLQPRLNAA
jgi:hypothetical protein